MAETSNECKYCKKNYSTNYNLNKHLKNCKAAKDDNELIKVKSDYEKRIDELKVELKNKHEEEIIKNNESCERKLMNTVNQMKKEYENELEKQKQMYENKISEQEYNYRTLLEKYHQLEISFLTKGEYIPVFKIIDPTNVNRSKLENILVEFKKGAYYAFSVFVTTMYKTTPPNVYLSDSARNKAKIFTGKWENIQLDRLTILLFEKSYRPIVCLYLPHFMREKGINGDAEDSYRMNLKTLNETKLKLLREEIRTVLINFKN